MADLNELVFAIVIITIKFAAGQCPEGRWLTFTRTSGYQPRLPVRPSLLYSSTYGSSINAECYNRCRESTDCAGYILDYATASCFKVETAPGFEIRLLDSPGVAYFAKTCLTLPNNCSEKAWSVELVPGYALYSQHVLTITDVDTKTDCAEACVTQATKGEPCLSANYDPGARACALSSYDRWTSPDVFVPTTLRTQEYIENICLTELKQQVCWKLPLVNKTSIRADLQLFNFTRQMCMDRCSDEVYFRCRAFSFLSKTGECLLHADAALSPGSGSSELYPQLQDTQGGEYVETMPCVDMTVECDKEHMNVTLHSENFNGRLSVVGRTNECTSSGKGNDATTLVVPLPTSENDVNVCNVQIIYAIGRYNRTQASAVLLVQRHDLIERAGDWVVRAVCLLTEGEPPPTMNNITLDTGYSVQGPSVQTEVTGEWGIVVTNFTEPRARLMLLDAHTGKLATDVKIGDPVVLRIEISPPYNVSLVRAHHLVASSGDARESLFLLDPSGCPPNPTIFPGLVATSNTTLDGRFVTFRFPSSPLLNLGVMLTFSSTPLQPTDCGTGVTSYGRRRRSTDAIFEEVPLQLSIVVRPQNSSEIFNPVLQASYGGDALDALQNGSNAYCFGFLSVSLLFLFFLLAQCVILTIVCICWRRKVKELRASDTISLGRDFDYPSVPRHVTFADNVMSYPPRDLRLSTPMKKT
ncbi:Zona pellucida-like domain [Nesidiocoris tenuis]|uniref:Zona pellucida-like domain n=1 Tax=Nesidiocoris tenuis TaxID=355587 RepID=A0ABN7B6S0_9HEMI|nr:Zona pellucida-like domain [Nesidiocoris tenuis]